MHKQDFCTGSSFGGNWNPATNEMSGFGIYSYPDGTVYRGFFEDGLFHGFGTVVLASNGFQIMGNFENGICKQVIEMKFSDGLPYELDNWKYCTGDDRRYWTEIEYGIAAVGDSAIDQHKPQRIIPVGCYDTEEGIFNPKTGFLMKSNKEELKNRIRFVSPEERKWIVGNCRHSSKFIKHKPFNFENCRQIIANDIKASGDDSEEKCTCVSFFDNESDSDLDFYAGSSQDSPSVAWCSLDSFVGGSFTSTSTECEECCKSTKDFLIELIYEIVNKIIK